MYKRQDVYIAKLQANKNKLDTINQTIRKYNQALLYCRQDNAVSYTHLDVYKRQPWACRH